MKAVIQRVSKASVTVDGELVSTAVIGEDITEPVDEVVLIGTKEEPVVVYDSAVPAGQTPNSGSVELDANGIPVSYSDVLTGEATAYTAYAGALTSTGRTAAVGLVAVDPDVIPYGTELYIVSADGTRTYGYAVAADTGGFTKKNPQKTVADLRMYFSGSKCQCGSYWGRRNVEIYILK